VPNSCLCRFQLRAGDLVTRTVDGSRIGGPETLNASECMWTEKITDVALCILSDHHAQSMLLHNRIESKLVARVVVLTRCGMAPFGSLNLG
jgi:hypothetical protein